MGTCLSTSPRKVTFKKSGKTSRRRRLFSSKRRRRRVDSNDAGASPRRDSASHVLDGSTPCSGSYESFSAPSTQTPRHEYERTPGFIFVSSDEDSDSSDGESTRRSGAEQSAARIDGVATRREVDSNCPSKCRPTSAGICRQETFHLGQRPSTAIAALTPVNVDVIDSGYAEENQSLCRSVSIKSCHVRHPSILEEEFSAECESTETVHDTSSPKKRRITDYRFLMVLGAGTFGKVLLAAEEPDRRHLSVIKAVKKSVTYSEMMERGEEYAEIEKKALLAVSGNPFFAQLKATFQNDDYLFYNLEFVSGGDLLSVMRRRITLFNEFEARFYVAEILIALQFLHRKNIIYRDLKPGNVLIDRKGHVKLCDMGASKEIKCLNKGKGRAKSVAGTVPYAAPEVLQEIPYYEACDFWSLGVLTYELIMGHTPFERGNVLETTEAVIEHYMRPFPVDYFWEACEDFIYKLLIPTARKRLGVTEKSRPIRQHKYFALMNWEKAEARKLRPPFLPELGCDDGRYFPKHFTELIPVLDDVYTHVDWTLDEFECTIAKAACRKEEEEENIAVDGRQTYAISKRHGLHNYELIRLIGEGQYAKVLLAQNRKTAQPCVIKAVSKAEMKVSMQMFGDEQLFVERDALVEVKGHPFFVQLLASFQNLEYLFYVMEFVHGGSMMDLLKKIDGAVSEEEARFFMCELIVALQFLHNKGIIHRDVKLENILIDEEGHARLCDFGMSKRCLHVGDGRTQSIAGTLQYVAPEVFKEGCRYNEAVDFWSLGVFLQEILTKKSPFRRKTEEGTKRAIKEAVIMPPCFLQTETRSLIRQLLRRNPAKRLGMVESSAPIRGHPFFGGMNWVAVEERRITPPFIPYQETPFDSENFTTRFASDDPFLETISFDSVDVNFEGFDWIPTEQK